VDGDGERRAGLAKGGGGMVCVTGTRSNWRDGSQFLKQDNKSTRSRSSILCIPITSSPLSQSLAIISFGIFNHA